jgi:hypothetical protein
MKNINARYYRDPFRCNAPVVIVVDVHMRSEMASGVAICSAKDNPCNLQGRALALGRALEAFGGKKNSQPIKRDEVKTLLTSKCLMAKDGSMLTGSLLKFKSVYWGPCVVIPITGVKF